MAECSRREFEKGRWHAWHAVMAVLLAVSASALAAPPAPIVHASRRVRAEGTRWVTADGKPVTLKGANLGNWLINEFWIMGFRAVS